jgi:hypothetical protein
VGDGGAGPGYGLYPLGGSEMRHSRFEWWQLPDLLRTAFPHQQSWNHYVDDGSYLDPWSAAGSLPIATLGCTMDVILVVTGAHPGQVWMDDRGSDGGIQPLADDFAGWYLDWLGTDPVVRR